jgi:DNA invertase Pin-like site-specific DNA recombinase
VARLLPANAPDLSGLLDRMENGDVLIVTKLDRLGHVRWISEKQ